MNYLSRLTFEPFEETYFSREHCAPQTDKSNLDALVATAPTLYSDLMCYHKTTGTVGPKAKLKKSDEQQCV